jgi:hypothetical protein
MTNLLDSWDEAALAAGDRSITTQELDDWARQREEAWEKHAQAAKHASELLRQAEEVEDKFILALEQAGRQKYHVEGIGTYSFSSRHSVPTPKTIEQKVAFAKYLEETGGKTLFWSTFGVNSQTLQSFYKNSLAEHEKMCEEKGTPEPFIVPGLEAPTARKSLRLTKDKPKGE